MTAQDLLKQLRGDYDESTGYTGNPNANALLAQYFANGGSVRDLTSNLKDENGNRIIPQDMFNSILNNYYSTIQPETLNSPQAFQQATGNPWGTTAGAIGELPEDAASVSVPVPQAPAGYVPYTPGQDLGDGNYLIDPNNVTTVNGLTYTPKSNIHMHPYGDFLSHFGPALASAAFLSAAGLGALPGASSGGLVGGASGGELAGGAGGGASLATGATTFPLSIDPVIGLPLGSGGGLVGGASGGEASGLAGGASGGDVAGAVGGGTLSAGSSLLDNILGGAKNILGLGSSSGLLGSLGSGIGDLLGSSSLGNLLGVGGALAALNYANNIPGENTDNLQAIYNDATNNEMPYVNSLVDQVIGPTSQGYGNLVQGLGKRGVLGSSFANQQINNYNTDTAQKLSDIASSGLQSSLGLRGTLAGLINNVNLTNQKLKTDLIGRALGAAGMGLRS